MNLFTALDEIVDYDLDEEDHQWLRNQLPIFRLTVNKLEKFIEFLEENCKNKVPQLEDFTSFFRMECSSEALRKVYDYWLDKRLKKYGNKLIYRHKTVLKKSVKNKKFDPYEAFRPCMEKMHLRKNRQVDRSNYMQMLKLRETIASDVAKHKNDLVESFVRQEILKHRFQNFQDLFQRRDFSGLFLDQQPIIDRDRILKNIEKKAVEGTVLCQEVCLESINKHQFKRKAGSQFHEVSQQYGESYGVNNTIYFNFPANCKFV